MGFIFILAWRDSRHSRRQLLWAAASIVLGVAALVSIGSFHVNLRAGIDRQSKGLLGADLAITSRQPLPPAAKAELAEASTAQAQEISLASMVVFPTSHDQTRLVTVRALDGAYPFFGDLVTAPTLGAGWLAEPAGAVVEETLLSQYGVRVGDPIKIGANTYHIRAALRKIPGDSAAVALLSPRIYLPLATFAHTGLLAPGSMVRYRTYLRLPASTDPAVLVTHWREKFSDLHLNFDTVEEGKRDLGQSLQNVYAFLNLVAFCSLLLGAIGVASAIHVYVKGKIATVAVLRCLGCSARQAFAIYLLQSAGVGILGAVAGTGLGVLVQFSLPLALGGLLPVDLPVFLAWNAIWRGLGTGLLVCVLFALLPLLKVRLISPLEALRSAYDEVSRRDPWRWVVMIALAVALAALATAQAPQRRLGVGYAGALAVTFGLLGATAAVAAWASKRLGHTRLPYVVRQGLANLHRPNNRTVLLLLSLGLGVFLLLTLALTRTTLLNEIRAVGGPGRPDLLFFDIQEDQIDSLVHTLQQQNAPVLAQAPVVTMRLSRLKGRPVDELLKDPSAHLPAWTLRREYRSTYRTGITDTEKLVAGTLPSQPVNPDAGDAPISVEEGLAQEMQVHLGDAIEWDVQGVSVKTRVASLRHVEWRRLQPNFFVVFPAGVLEAAPKSFIVATRAGDSAQSARLQQAAIQKFPNVSAIDLALILQTLDGVFSKIEYAVQFMSLFTVSTGLVVLLGVLYSGRAQRLRETVLLRTLGATRRQLLRIQLCEYTALGLLAAAVGGGLAFGANGLLSRFVFHTPAAAPLAYWAYATGALVAATLAAGIFAARGVADQPPLAILREDI